MDVIKASTPGEARDQIVTWLREKAIHTQVDSRIATRKRAKVLYEAKADALNAAATFIQNMEIKSLSKPKTCPNCGEEML